ncbi:MAG: hypothetical protein HYY58_00570 [Candidatus Omnitrophica bacterium]|nr:hypothetical protein [Candidatus Omnitrophota bacterium]
MNGTLALPFTSAMTVVPVEPFNVRVQVGSGGRRVTVAEQEAVCHAALVARTSHLPVVCDVMLEKVIGVPGAGIEKYAPRPPDEGLALGLQEYSPPLAALADQTVAETVATPLGFALTLDALKLTPQLAGGVHRGELYSMTPQLCPLGIAQQ